MQIVLNGVRKDFSQAVISYFSPWRVIINAWKVIINAGMVLLSAVSGVEITFRLNMDLLSDCFINFAGTLNVKGSSLLRAAHSIQE